jgi:hypothetical protein
MIIEYFLCGSTIAHVIVCKIWHKFKLVKKTIERIYNKDDNTTEKILII